MEEQILAYSAACGAIGALLLGLRRLAYGRQNAGGRGHRWLIFGATLLILACFIGQWGVYTDWESTVQFLVVGLVAVVIGMMLVFSGVWRRDKGAVFVVVASYILVPLVVYGLTRLAMGSS